jgi:glutamine cyclotransferase
VNVMEGNSPIKRINELEYIRGYIFANVWETPMILKIDPANGKVVGKLDMINITNEIKAMYPNADVLNGIAFDANSKAMLITGKLWPKTYLIKIK